MHYSILGILVLILDMLYLFPWSFILWFQCSTRINFNWCFEKFYITYLVLFLRNQICISWIENFKHSGKNSLASINVIKIGLELIELVDWTDFGRFLVGTGLPNWKISFMFLTSPGMVQKSVNSRQNLLAWQFFHFCVSFPLPQKTKTITKTLQLP
jgi:hypothetical protein